MNRKHALDNTLAFEVIDYLPTEKDNI